MAYHQQFAGPSSPPYMGYPAQLSSQPRPQAPFATPVALPPAPSGYQYQLVPVASPPQSWASPNSIPSSDPSTTPTPPSMSAPPQLSTAIQATPAPTTLDYPYILTGKHQMTLFTPDRSQALFIVNYPDTWSLSWSKSRNMTMLRASNGERLAHAEFHSFSTSKVDAYYRGHVYHFKKRFVSQTGLGSEPGFVEDGVTMLWDVWNGEMTLGREDGRGGIVARFVPRGDAAGLGDHTNILEGRLELRMVELTDAQFEELFVTLVAEMERKRRGNEEWAVADAVVG